MPVRILITEGTTADCKQAEALIDNIKAKVLLADRGYDAEGNRLHTGCMGEDFVYMVQDGLIDRDSLTTFGEIIRGKKPGRESDDEIILVSIEGMPTEDVAWAYECYTYALVHDIGTKLKVWDHPYAF